MKVLSNKILGMSMAAGAIVAAVGIGAQPAEISIQAAPATPVHVSPPPPSPPPPPPPPVQQYDPSQDYWTGQGSGGGAPGGAGGGG